MEANQLPRQANRCETYKYCTSLPVKRALLTVRSECPCALRAVGGWPGPPEKSGFKGGSRELQRLAFTSLRPCSFEESFQYNESAFVHHPYF